MDLEIVDLGAAVLVNGTPNWQATVPVANDNSKTESFGEVDTYQALGFASQPAPPDADGKAEAIGVRGACGRDFVAFGGRDTRSAEVQGKLGPGDTAIFATGPKNDAVAQVQCKAKKRQVLMATENSKRETMLFMLDGKNDKAQWTCSGAIIEIDKEGRIIFTAARGAGLILDDKAYVVGEFSLPGMTPGFALMEGPPTGSPGGGASAPLLAVKGVSQ